MKELTQVFRGPADNIDSTIAKRQLDRHPEYLDAIIDELGLRKMIKDIENRKILKIIPNMMASRVLNFEEAACLAGFTLSERRVGVAALIVLSCIHMAEYREVSTSAPVNSCSPIPTFIRRLMDYSKVVNYGVQPEKIPEIDMLIRMFTTANPSRSSLRNNRTAFFMRDACLGWITGGNPELTRFICGDLQLRKQYIAGCANRQIVEASLGLYTNTLLYDLGRPQIRDAFTQWGMARNFNRNISTGIAAVTAVAKQ